MAELTEQQRIALRKKAEKLEEREYSPKMEKYLESLSDEFIKNLDKKDAEKSNET